MNERTLHFSVGIFVLAALVMVAALLAWFGELDGLFRQQYTIYIRLSEAAGVAESTAVHQAGVRIGAVTSVSFDDRAGGVLVEASIDQRYSLRPDARPTIRRSLLGDATIEFRPGRTPGRLEAGSVVEGEVPPDLVEVAQQVQDRLGTSLETFSTTAEEWRLVARRLNTILDTNGPSIDQTFERAGMALAEFSETMRHATAILGSSENQENLRATLAQLPELTRTTQETIVAVRRAVVLAEENLENLRGMTQPLAEHSASIVAQLDDATMRANDLLIELRQFAHQLQDEEGTLYLLTTNPDLYRNLNEAAASLNVVLTGLRPAVADLQVFADRIARHPELLGISGAISGSSGLIEEQTPAQPTGFQP